MSRRIRLRHVNLVLWAVIAVLAILYGRELRWAAAELPGYLDGTFSETPERQLYLEAAEILEYGGDRERARDLLTRSLEIDPRGEAGFWLGRYHELEGDDAQALAVYERYLDTDPVLLETWLRIAAIHRRADRVAEARAALERGLRWFEAREEDYRPFVDRSVSPEHNAKARRTYNHYVESLVTLRSALASLGADPDGEPSSSG